MKFLFLVFFVALCSLSSCLSIKVPALSGLPEHWFMAEANLPFDQEVTLKLALYPKDASKLESTLLAASTPGSSSFRKYLSKKQITAIVGRSDEEIDRVGRWLEAHGAKISSVHPHRDWIVATASVKATEAMLNCELGLFTNTKTSASKIAAWGAYEIPDEVSDLIEMVSGLSTLPSGRWSVVKDGVGAELTSAVTPDTIYSTYSSSGDSVGNHGSKLGSQAVVEFGKLANFNEDDTQTFFKTFQSNLTGEVVTVVYGSNNGKIKPSVEANLDVQYIMAAGTFVNTTDYKITSSNNIEDEFLDYTMLVNSENQPPLVHSISYGAYGGSYDNATDQRFSYELQKMGIAGISVLLASGDNGVGCNTAGTSQEFDYPSSPYITMVGATYLDKASGKEIGATLSSGGFSKDFMQASWQESAVNSYFASGVTLPSESYYKEGRAYPDVAAFGQNVQVVASGSTEAVSGTSCSAPIFAGLISLINNELLSAGEAPLGFLNPWLYANPQAFTDITSGSNPYQKCQGFQASVGWDPVTGLGTPVYTALKKAAFDALSSQL